MARARRNAGRTVRAGSNAGSGGDAPTEPPDATGGEDGKMPAVVGSEAAFNRFIGEARALGKAPICRADATLAYHNVTVGSDWVLSREAELKKDLPNVDLEPIRSLPELGLALIFAASQVDRSNNSSGVLKALQDEARPLRTLLLSTAHTAVAAQLIAARDVAHIRKGRGSLDAAKDLVNLVALFRKHAKALAGKTPVTAAHLERAAELGTQLQTMIVPRGGGRARKGAAGDAAAADRDALFALMKQRHVLLWRLGAWLAGPDGIEQAVPSLQARYRPISRAKRAEQQVKRTTQAAERATQRAKKIAEKPPKKPKK